MTLCWQVTNYPIDALKREEINTTYTGSNNVYWVNGELMEHTRAGRESVPI